MAFANVKIVHKIAQFLLPLVDPGQSPLIISLPNLLLYLLMSFNFPFFPFLLASSIFLLFHPFPFYHYSPTPFPGWIS